MLHFVEHPIKKIDQGWKSFTVSNVCVQLSSQIIDMLESGDFLPELRIKFKTAFQNLRVGQSIILPLGQEPKLFVKGYQGRQFFITSQMIDIWNELTTNQSSVLFQAQWAWVNHIQYLLLPCI
jgi:hypothetical protein